jgi:hypothetical protein
MLAQVLAALLPLAATTLGNNADVVGAWTEAAGAAGSGRLLRVQEPATGLQSGVVAPTASGKTRAGRIMRGIAKMLSLCGPVGGSEDRASSASGGGSTPGSAAHRGTDGGKTAGSSAGGTVVLTHATPQALLRVLADSGGVVMMFGDEVKASLPGVLDGLGSAEDAATLMDCMTGNASIEKVRATLSPPMRPGPVHDILQLAPCAVFMRA